jgi:RNA polymerase sigma factor (sigma-70 family)
MTMLQQTLVDPAEPAAATRPSWEQVVARHSARVHRHALRLTGNRADAEDLTQDVFMRVFRSLDSYDDSSGSGSFEGWLHRITTNLFLDQVRRKARLRFDPLGDALEGLGSAPAVHDVALPGAFDADVEGALSALPPEFRAPVLLADVDGLSYEEVAEVLGLKLGTVRSRIHRGRSRLRRALAHRAPGDQRHRYSGPTEATPLPVGG